MTLGCIYVVSFTGKFATLIAKQTIRALCNSTIVASEHTAQKTVVLVAEIYGSGDVNSNKAQPTFSHGLQFPF